MTSTVMAMWASRGVPDECASSADCNASGDAEIGIADLSAAGGRASGDDRASCDFDGGAAMGIQEFLAVLAAYPAWAEHRCARAPGAPGAAPRESYAPGVEAANPY